MARLAEGARDCGTDLDCDLRLLQSGCADKLQGMSEAGNNQFWDERQRLKIIGVGFLFMAIGVGMNAVPRRWP